MIALGSHDTFIRYSFPFLLVVVGTFAWVILRRPRVVILFSRAFLAALVVTWLVVMDERLLAPPEAGQGWAALFPQTFMGFVLFAVIGYLVYPTRVALLHALAVTGGSVVVGLIALHTGPDHDAHVTDLLRFGVYMLVLTGMVYVLSRAKERAARAFRSAANATIEAAAMREMAYRDPLTGAANRRRLLDELTYQSVAAAEGGHVAVVYLDVDHFKRINDERGHLGLTKRFICFEPALAADQIIEWAACLSATRHGDRLLEAQLSDVIDNVLESVLVARPGIHDADQLDRNHLDALSGQG